MKVKPVVKPVDDMMLMMIPNIGNNTQKKAYRILHKKLDKKQS